MSAVASKVGLSLNLINLHVDLLASVSSERGTTLSNFCVGVDVAHAPAKVVAPMSCPECKNQDKETFVKGRKEGKGYTLIAAETLAEATAIDTKFTEGMEFTYHPASDVDAATMPIDSPYYLATTSLTSPEASIYALLATWIAANPDIALLTRYAVRSSMATYRLICRSGVLMLSKVCFPADMKAAPAVPVAFDDKLLIQLDGMIRSQLAPFDASDWINERDAILGSAAADLAPDYTETGGATVIDIAELIKSSTKKSAKAKRVRKPKAELPVAESA